MGLGWVLLPFLVIADDGARAVGSDNALLQILVAGVVGGATGLILGVTQLGWRGLLGAIVGALSGGLLPYLIVAPLLAIQVPGVDFWGQYLIVAVAATVGSAVGVVYATRSALRVSIRPLTTIAIGLVVLVVWIMALWAIGLSSRSVS
jgi:hypothetical protein